MRKQESRGRYLFDEHPAQEAELRRLKMLIAVYEKKTLELIRSFGLSHSATVLDVGCGIGGPLHQLASETTGTVYGLDISGRLLDIAYKNAKQKDLSNIKYIHNDMSQLPFCDGSFDLVFSRFALKHSFDPSASVKEMCRVLKDKGVLCVIDKDMLAGVSLWHPGFPLRDTALLRAINLQNRLPSRGGNSNIGRMLKGLFVKNGLTVRSVDIEVCAMTAGDSPDASVHRENFLAVYRNNIPLLVQDGLIDMAQASDDMRQLETFLEVQQNFAATVTFTVIGMSER